MSQENSQNPPNPSQQNPSSENEEDDEASSNPNVPNSSSIPPPIPQFQDPSSISAGIDPQTEAASIKSQDPFDLSLTLGRPNQKQPISTNRPEIQESSNVSHEIDVLGKFENLNLNRPVQESLNVKRRLDFSKFEPPAKKPTPVGRQGKKATGIEFRRPTAPETRTAGDPRQSSHVSREIDVLGKFENLNLNRLVQESLNVKRQLDFSKCVQPAKKPTPVGRQGKKATGIEFRQPTAPETRTAGDPRQSSGIIDVGRQIEEREVLHAIQESRKTFKEQQKGEGPSGVVIGESSAPETRTKFDGVVQETGASSAVIQENSAPEKQEGGNSFLLRSSKSEEEDDYKTLKFLSAFGTASLPAELGISLSDFIKKGLPDCNTITEARWEGKVLNLFNKHVELCAKFNGEESQEGREYEMFKMGRIIWGDSGDPVTHQPDPTENVDPGVDAAMSDPEANVGQGSGANPAANVGPVAGHPNVNVDMGNGSDPNPGSDVQQGGENAGVVRVEDPGEIVDHGVTRQGDKEAGADPRENMDLV